jgi:hypothetical protein
LEAACSRALNAGAISYRSVKSILDAKLDQATPQEEQLQRPIPEHPNVRGAGYYA